MTNRSPVDAFSRPTARDYDSRVQSILPGFLVSISLIAAIGAQNAMVLRHGIARSPVAAVAAFCIVSDAILMSAGTA